MLTKSLCAACCFALACVPVAPPLQPPAPFALAAHEANAEAAARVDLPDGHGSGVRISKGGLVLTDEHVVRHAEAGKPIIALLRVDGFVRRLEAVLVAADPVRDLALIRLEDPPPGTVAQLADDADVRTGDRIYAIGYPASRGLTTIWGTVRAMPFSVDMRPDEPAAFRDGILADLPTEDGSSGQGVFSASTGKLIGVHKLGAGSADGPKAVLISVKEIRRFLKEKGVTVP